VGKKPSLYLIVSDDAEKESENLAEELVRKWVPMRGSSGGKYVDVSTALDRAAAAGEGPVVIADVADNPGTLNIDFASIPFKRIPRPMWPLDDIPDNEF
jgi:microcystin degradation protein MlrC